MPGLPTGTVTFLFTDMEGSTRLLQEVGDAGYARVLAEHRRLLRAAFDAGDGREIETQGDGFLVAFQGAREAVATAVFAQLALKTHPWPDGAMLRVRMGLHTGEPISAGGGYVGLDVHRAQRICSAGHGGQILLSQSTRNLIEHELPGDARLRDLGLHRLKDLRRPEKVFQLLHPELTADFAPLKTLDALTNNLPVQLSSFVGREREIAEIKRLLGAARLLTLTGSGGSGKSRLALQVAAEVLEEFEDGVWLVELAALSDAGLVHQWVALSLGVPEQSGRPLLASLVDYLQLKQLLLVLDNCEHVVAACATLTHTLLRACPSLRILATSREGLGIAGEIAWGVPPLTLPDPQPQSQPETLLLSEAGRLFFERAVAAAPDFAISTSNVPSVVEICRQLDGIPLAIELAAARVRVLPVDQIAARLNDRFRLLTRGSRTALPRQQTLRATMDWSYELLSREEQALLRRLSVFVGGFTLEATEAICAGGGVEEPGVLDLLTHLVNKSLVIMDEYGGRYRLLETVRQYGLGKLVESSEAAGVRQKHRDWYLGLAVQAEPTLLGAGEAWMDRLEIEHDNLRAALELSLGNSDADAGLRLAGALWRFWQVRGFWTEGRQWLEAMLAAASDSVHAPCGKALRAKALTAAAALAQYQGDYERAVALAEESLASQQERGDKQGIAASLNILGNVMYEKGNYRAARKFHEESLACGREVGDRHAVAASLVNLAAVADHEGDYELAAGFCEESLALFREVDDKRGSAFALNMLGILASDQGDYVAARTRYEESLAIRREMGDKRGIAGSLSNLGLVAREQGDVAAARARYEESLAIRRELGDKHGIAASLRSLGLAAWRQGDDTRATELLQESLVIRRTLGTRVGTAESLEALARIARDPERAARLVGAAAALREAVGARLPPSDRSDYNRQLEVARASLGDTAFAAAWDQGRAMTLEQAIEYALTAGTA
ncbi:MAG: ATP-binding protein [Armatimonadota bacterium]